MATDTSTAADVLAPPTTVWSRSFVLTWISTWLIFIGFYFLLPTLPGYLLSIGGRPAQVGWLIGLFTITAMLFRPIGGRLSDTRGKPWTMLVGASVLTATMLFYWVVKTPASLLTLRFFQGMGWAVYLTGAVSLISDIAHPSQRATMTGHYFLANTLAMVIGPWLGVLILSHSNYTVLFTASIGITALALPILWPLHKSAPPFQRQSNGRWISPRAWLPSLTLLSAGFTYGGLVSFLPLYADEKQVSLFFVVYAVSLGVTRPVGGWVADRLGRHTVIVPCLFLLAVSMAGLSRVHSTSGFVAFAIVYGIAFGGAGPSLNAFTIDRVPPAERGAGMGMYTACFEFGLSIGSVLLGFVMAHLGMARMWLVAAVSPLVGLVFFEVGRRKQP